jgi:hypothetical protein
MSEAKRRVPAQKLVSFEDSTKGYLQAEREVENGWSVVSMVPHDKKYICVLEKIDNSTTKEDEVVIQSPGKKKKLIIQD